MSQPYLQARLADGARQLGLGRDHRLAEPLGPPLGRPAGAKETQHGALVAGPARAPQLALSLPNACPRSAPHRGIQLAGGTS